MISNTKYQILNTKQKGFTLIEALALLFVFSLITLTFYQVITVGLNYILLSKNRLNAVAIANEKMEIVRNLKYDDIGTIGGVCEGIISQNENVIRDEKEYHVYTLVKYEDDPFDGTLGGSPNDIAYKDYKTAKIKISWSSGGNTREVSLTSKFTSPSLEVASLGDGILSINVFSDQAGGAGVSQATVHVVNNDVGVNQTIQTDGAGNVMLVGAKESIKNYQITVSKSGYETVSTFPDYPDTAYNPVDVHASVIGGTLNVTNIIQNKTADLKAIAKDYLGNIVSDVDFDLSGGRKLGTGADFPNDPVYNLNVSASTDLSGEKEFDSISPGQYIFTLSSSEDDYVLTGIDPISPFSLVSDTSLDLNVKVANKNITSFLAKIINDSDGSPIFGAEVNLKSEPLSYDQTVETEDEGMAFFPKEDVSPVLAGTYELKISKSGFQEHSEEIGIIDGELFNKTITMMAE